MVWRFKAAHLYGAVALSALFLGMPATSNPFMPLAFAQTQMQTLPSIADLAEKLLPAVVEISVVSKVSSPADATPMPQIPDDSPFKDFFDEFLKKKQQQGQGGDNGSGDNPVPAPQDDRTVNSMGSGFIIDATGLIVTNNHVVEGADTIQVHMQDGTIMKAELVGRDPKTDVAVIRVKPAKSLPIVEFGDSDHVRIGEWVIAIGNPFGLGGSVSLGIVSARNRDINAGPYDDYIQTDAAINKGNSGGPLIDLQGKVVGINSAIFSPTGGSVGIGFSVPSNTAKSVVAQLVKFGETRRGWLGVKIQMVTPDIAESMGMDKSRGALIADVTPGSPSEKAGLVAGDVIVQFDGRAIVDSKELPRVVAETEVGKEVPVKVIRDGKEQDVKVTLGRLEDGEKLVAKAAGAKAPPASAAPTTVTLLGMTVSSLTDDLRSKFKTDEKVKGALVTEVAKDGAAIDKGVGAGDVILEAGGKAVESSADVSAAIDAATKDGKASVLLLIAKAGKVGETRFIALKLKK
jgi:serine protease Do